MACTKSTAVEKSFIILFRFIIYLPHHGNSYSLPLCIFLSIRLFPHLQLQDKRLKILLNGNRKLIGTLRGYDAFLNVVLEDVDQDQGGYLGQVVVRGNSVIQFEALERVK